MLSNFFFLLPNEFLLSTDIVIFPKQLLLDMSASSHCVTCSYYIHRIQQAFVTLICSGL